MSVWGVGVYTRIMFLALTDFSQALAQGTAHAWFFIPTAILLGVLHGLEPGHSKTMMAAFIVAIRGTVWQAVLLGLSAALSHSLLIWVLAAVALKYGGQWNAETTEPYFHIASAVIIAALAIWMFWRTRRDLKAAADHTHGDGHGHGHDDTKVINTGHGLVKMSVFEDGVPPVFRLEFSEHGKVFVPTPASVVIETVRSGAIKQTFAFAARDGFLESTTDIPEPHEFDLTLTVAHDGHSHSYPLQFREGHDHDHGHSHAGHGHSHSHGAGSHSHGHVHDETKVIRTDLGLVKMSVFEEGVPPVFRLEFMARGKSFLPEASTVAIETVRPGGARQQFAFAPKAGFLESTTDIPEPHEFDLTLTLSHDGHAHTYSEQFREDHDHGHSHGDGHSHESDHEHADLPKGVAFQDAHEAAHALDIQKRFKNRTVTTPQIILFGLTGGLLPCPAAFTVLIVCMQVKQFVLGFALVAAFSFGLALTMVTVGAVAAWSINHAEKKFSGFGELMRKAPYISCALLIALACYMGWQGWQGLAGHH